MRVNFFQVLALVERKRNGGVDYPFAADMKLPVRPWRVSEAVWMASLDVVLAGVGYLL